MLTVAPYIKLRERYGLGPVNWSTINPNLYSKNPNVSVYLLILTISQLIHACNYFYVQLIEKLEELYDHDIQKLDAYVGGMLGEWHAINIL